MIFYVLLVLALYVFTAIVLLVKHSAASRSRDNHITGHTLLVISHPDDECMFFGPSVLRLASKLRILCLSSGDHYGHGRLRKNELLAAAKCLKVSHVRIEDNKSLRDGALDWDEKLIAQIVAKAISQHRIENLVTFDDGGVSGHPNHVAAFKSVAEIKRLCPAVNIYSLESVNIVRKYLSFLELPISLLAANLISRPRTKLIYVLDFAERRRLLSALYQHTSQMVWFRYLYAAFSRYLFVNTLNKL